MSTQSSEQISSGLYEPVSAYRIPVRMFDNFANVNGEIKAPLNDDQWLQFAVVVVINANDDMAELTPAELELVRVSANHCRVFEVSDFEYEVPSEGQTDFSILDDYENIFWVLNLKANDLTKPEIVCSKVEPDGFRFVGIMTHRSLHRCLVASAAMRELGVGTELIAKVFEPLGFPLNGRMVSIPEFKQFLLDQAMATATDEVENDEHELRPLAKSDIPALIKVIEDTTFFTVLRAMTTNERMPDYALCEDKAAFDDMVRRVMTRVNYTNYHKNELMGEMEFPYFNPDEVDDVNAFFYSYLPDQIVYHLAVMANFGLHHRYYTLGNMIADGGIADLDSVHGKYLGLGDEAVNPDELHKEAYLAILWYRRLLFDLVDKGYLEAELYSVWPKAMHDDKVVVNSRVISNVRLNMEYDYLRYRDDHLILWFLTCLKNDREFVPFLLAADKQQQNLLPKLWDRISAQLMWNMTTDLQPIQAFEAFLQKTKYAVGEDGETLKLEAMLSRAVLDVVLNKSPNLLVEYQGDLVDQVRQKLSEQLGMELDFLTRTFTNTKTGELNTLAFEFVLGLMIDKEVDRVLYPVKSVLRFVLSPPPWFPTQLAPDHVLNVIASMAQLPPSIAPTSSL